MMSANKRTREINKINNNNNKQLQQTETPAGVILGRNLDWVPTVCINILQIGFFVFSFLLLHSFLSLSLIVCFVFLSFSYEGGERGSR